MIIGRTRFLASKTGENALAATASDVPAQLIHAQGDDQRSLDAAVSEGSPVLPLYPRVAGSKFSGKSKNRKLTRGKMQSPV